MNIIFPYGLNENDDAQPDEAYKGSYNFDLELNRKDYRPRSPFDLVATTDNAGDVRSMMQLVTRANAVTTLVQSGDIVYSWDGSSFTTEGACSASARLRSTYWSLDDYLIITDVEKKEEIKKWDGSTYGTQGTGLINCSAKYGITWNNRVWLFNLTENAVDLSHVVVASAFEDPTDFTTSLRAGDSSFVTGNEAFYLISPDLKPINGVAEFQNQLIFSTVEGRLYRIIGDDSSNYAIVPFYSGSYAVGDESIANIGNDVTYMRRGGRIESLIATDTFGDVGADDMSRWIPDTVNDLDSARIVYDQNKQRVYYFVANKCLVYFKDIAPSQRSPWSVYKTTLNNTMNASSALYLKTPGGSAYTTYWGDSTGNIYNMHGVGANGDGGTEDIVAVRKTYYLDADFRMMPMVGRIKYVRINEVEAIITLDWGDDLHQAISSITLKGSPDGDTGVYYGGSFYYGGSHYYGEGFTFANRVSSRGFSPTGRGPGFYLSVQVTGKRTFQIREIEFPKI